jgi:uncharacterized membrane protein YgcG
MHTPVYFVAAKDSAAEKEPQAIWESAYLFVARVILFLARHNNCCARRGTKFSSVKPTSSGEHAADRKVDRRLSELELKLNSMATWREDKVIITLQPAACVRFFEDRYLPRATALMLVKRMLASRVQSHLAGGSGSGSGSGSGGGTGGDGDGGGAHTQAGNCQKCNHYQHQQQQQQHQELLGRIESLAEMVIEHKAGKAASAAKLK